MKSKTFFTNIFFGKFRANFLNVKWLFELTWFCGFESHESLLLLCYLKNIDLWKLRFRELK